MTSIYDFPQAYDAVLARAVGVVESEVESIDRLLCERGLVGGHILEIACGAGAHAVPLAARGYKVTGFDRSPAMLSEARCRADAAHVSIELSEADWVGFDLGMTQIDAAIFLYETFPLITKLDDVLAHFASVRRHLRNGGTYIIDVDSYGNGIQSGSGEWGRRIVSILGGTVETWYEDRPGNWIGGTNSLVLHCRIRQGEELHVTRDEWTVHRYTPWDLALLARALSDWRLCDLRSWRELGAVTSTDAHYFAVFEAA